MEQQKTQDTTQLLTWLDEQQREDRQQLAELRKLTEVQSQEMEALIRRLEDLEHRLAGTQAQLLRFSEIEGALQTLKSELIGVVEESEGRLAAQDTQLESRLETQAPQLTNLAKLMESVQGTLSTLENRIEAIPAEIEDQTTQIVGLARDIEELETRFNQTQARLVELKNQLASQSNATAMVARQLEHLGSRLSNTQAQLTKFPQIEAALQELREELVLMIRNVEEERAKEARESAKLRAAELKEIRVVLDSLERRLEPIPHLEERVKALAAEDKRLRELIVEHAQEIPPLRESIAEHRERISYLEEERPRISRRIDGLETQLPPLHEGIEENAGKIKFLEEWAQRSAETIDAFKRLEDRMAQWQAAFVEEIRQGERHRDRRLTDWEKVLEEHAELVREWQEILRRFEVEHQDNLRAVQALQTLPERLEQDRAELAEKQRLADERIQRELEAWQEENEKRWHLFLKQRGYDWEQQAKRDAEQDRRIEPLEAWRIAHAALLEEELERLDENDRRILTRMAEVARYLEKALAQQIKHYKAQGNLLSEELRPADFDLLITRSRAERRARTGWSAAQAEGGG